MNDIGPEAKSLFEAARKAEGLPGPQRTRIKRAVLLQAATLGAASTLAGGAVAMSVTTKVTLVAVAAAALGGGSAFVWAWKKHKESTPMTRAVPTQPRARLAMAKPALVHQSPAQDEPMPVPAAVPMEPQRRAPARPEVRRASVNPIVMERPANPSPVTASPPIPVPRADHLANPLPVTGSTPRPAVANAPMPPEPLDAELALLRQAQEDLRLGVPAQALGRLADFDRRFPKPRLDQERKAIEAIAGCQAYPGLAATARARSFLLHAPLSPLAARVRSACHVDEIKSSNENSPHREP